jgi:membrane associated rhomboid family serine protease
MREPGEIAAAFPRPGRTLKALLAILAVFAIAGAVVVNWAPGGQTGADLFRALAFEPGRALQRPWALLSSGLLTSPDGISHALWSLFGLYVLTPDLEKHWGGGRLVRFLATAVLVGNLFVLAGSLVLPAKPVFHPPIAFGPTAAITAAVIAWSKEHASRQIRFMFFLPMSGKTLYWLTIGLALLSLLFLQGTPEGALAPLGGIATGIVLAGNPSPVRALWLRFRLGRLRRHGGGITVEQLLSEDAPARPRTTPRRGGKAPPLRVVQGGLEEDLKNRKPPKDKRYLN